LNFNKSNMKKQTETQTFEDAIPKPQTIWYKLWCAKQEIGKITKGSNNPFFKSKYADLNTIIEAVEPILHKYNLLLLQPIQGNHVCSQIIDIETGERIESSLELPNIQEPQKLIASITCYRRGSLQTMLSLQAVDDDGNEASKAVKEQKTEVLTLNEKQFISAVGAINAGKYTVQYFFDKYSLTPEQINVLNELNA